MARNDVENRGTGTRPGGGGPAVYSARLSERAAIAALAAILLLALALGGHLSWSATIVGLLLLPVWAALWPREERVAAEAPVRAGEDQAARAILRAFADAVDDPCLLLDRRTVIVHRNEPAAHQFPTLLVGTPLALSLRHPDVIAAAATTARRGTAQRVDLHQTVPTETWYRVHFAPIEPSEPGWSEESGAGLIVVTLQNVTEQKRVDAMRQDFIANVSHELRTPLTSLIGFIDTLLGPAANDAAARSKFLGLMRGQAERMARLVEDLLSLSRIEMRQHRRPTDSVDIASILREAAEGLQLMAGQAGTEIAMRVPDGPAMVTGDREELFEAVQNLLDNAIKYGGPGKQVELELREVRDRPGYAYAVSVTDHGPGVGEEHVPRLTERFYRVDAESSRRKKGTGLGLAIVKHIVTRHRGVLSIRSRHGEGMRVEILLPA